MRWLFYFRVTYMKRFIITVALLHFLQLAYSQITEYRTTHVMIPMRDGKKLFTVVLSPLNGNGKYPFLIQRTPYGAQLSSKNNETVTINENFQFTGRLQLHDMAREGYIFVFQDVRGKFRSEGYMEIHQPLIHHLQKNAVDESTDTWDTIDWLLKNIPGNNGRAGMIGVSYAGWLALTGSAYPHPALKATSPQGTMGDLFIGDDFHHNGAFRLSYGMEYSYEVEHDRTADSDFPFPQFDLYDWYLKLGSLKNVNEKYFHNSIPTWNNFVDHPNYDAFWQKNSPLNYISYPAIPHLHVGGYYDQEDINGPQLMYEHLEKRDSFSRNHIILGPWYHGQWGRFKGDSISRIDFGSNTGEWFRVVQKKWFDYWLKDIGNGKFDEVSLFQTGSNRWQTFTEWPIKNTSIRKLYAGKNNSCSFNAPVQNGSVSFVSDPAHPVPYRLQPIEATYGTGSRWKPWQVEDQRFVYSRPDVISFTSESFTEDFSITGKITAHIFASTTATDADWIVKLIDVYPDNDSDNLLMSQYQFPVAMEVLRGRYRKSLQYPSPLVPGKPEEFVIDLHTVNHTIKKGHRIMIQVQSSWFPLIDRNPQKYVSNIFKADDNDFIKATHTIYFSPQYPTHLDLPVVSR